MNYNKLNKLAAIFQKSAQGILEPGTSENDIPGYSELIVDKQTSISKIAQWLKMIQNSARPLRHGWGHHVAQIVFQSIVDGHPNPIEYAAVEMNMPNGKTAMDWAVLDIRNHYSDIINHNDVKKVLSLFL